MGSGADVTNVTWLPPGVRALHPRPGRSRLKECVYVASPTKRTLNRKGQTNDNRTQSAMKRCGAKTRRGTSCQRYGIGRGGRCPLHGGKSTGPKTAKGIEKNPCRPAREVGDVEESEPRVPRARAQPPYRAAYQAIVSSTRETARGDPKLDGAGPGKGTCHSRASGKGRAGLEGPHQRTSREAAAA